MLFDAALALFIGFSFGRLGFGLALFLCRRKMLATGELLAERSVNLHEVRCGRQQQKDCDYRDDIERREGSSMPWVALVHDELKGTRSRRFGKRVRLVLNKVHQGITPATQSPVARCRFMTCIF